MEMAAILNTGRFLLDNLKGLGAVADSLKNADLKQRILDAQSQALDLQEKCAQLARENEVLRDDREFEKTLTFRDGCYWSTNPKNPGPFCPTCWGKDRKPVPIQPLAASNSRFCYVCETYVDMPGGRPPDAQPDDFPPPRDPIY